jgi:DNA-binding transcriptional regulator YiaG
MEEMQNDAMTPNEFEAALKHLGWKPADFCRLADVHRNTVSRWVNNQVPIPGWARRFLEMAQEIKRLSKLIEPQKQKKDE